jgi:DNA-binding transcriptional LysR family regulator
MDRHQAIQCFCRVVETGSFAAAARDLDCSRSVVTKYIQHLEEWTASRLLARTTRSMQLTEAGEQFYDYCRRVVADTENTLEAIRDAGDAPGGRLVVSAPVSLTLGFLGPHLHAFQALHPKVSLEVRLTDRPSDIVRDGFDVALRGQARLEDSRLVAAALMTLERTLCAAPAYWQQHGKPVHPEELARHNCLPYLLGSDAHRWHFFGPDGEHTVAVQGNFRTDNSLFLIDAIARGAGVGLVPEALRAHSPQRDALEPAMTTYRAEPRNLYAVYPSRDYLPAKTRAFVRFLRTRLAGTSTNRNSTEPQAASSRS